MNSLLKRQIRKYLPEELKDRKDLEKFFDAVNRSYITADDQFALLQRAAAKSSEELFESNHQLRKESKSQKEIISRLNNVVNTLKTYGLEEAKNLENLDSLALLDFIENQTKEVLAINKQKDKLVANLELQNQELNDYTHMVSHDLKSPLQSIDALTAWIQEDYSDDLGKEGENIVNLIRENVEKMDTVIRGILQYSTIGKVEKERYEINLDTLIDAIILKIHNPNNVKVLKLGTFPSVHGDVHRLELLFYHLIDNAVKFNDKAENGIVEISCFDEVDFWKFSIKDNGIEKNYFNKIFVAFQKLEDDFKSEGIGLSIVQKIVQAYEGNISLESTLNVETNFTFTLRK